MISLRYRLKAARRAWRACCACGNPLNHQPHFYKTVSNRKPRAFCAGVGQVHRTLLDDETFTEWARYELRWKTGR